MKLTRVIFILAALASVLRLDAQDIHFSQFYLSPMNLNPALTGVMACNHRFTINYRNQYASILKSNAYRTIAASYDSRIPVGRYDNFGWGASLWADKAGESNFSTLEARAHLAYAKRVAGYRKKSTYVVVGGEGGVAQRRIDFLRLRWGTQNDGGVFDPNLPTQEDDFLRDNFLFADFGAGLLFYSILNETDNFYIGGAYSHLNRADQSFTSSDDDVFEAWYSKVTAHAGAEFMFGKGVQKRIGIVPGIVAFFQGPSMQINGGTSVKFLMGHSSQNHQAFLLGAWLRMSNAYSGLRPDALILSARFDYNEFTLGLSYDATVSKLRAANNMNGAYELALMYKICRPDNRGVYCPTF
jgi:type IX secretion system PorP/SprF family membrane protein